MCHPVYVEHYQALTNLFLANIISTYPHLVEHGKLTNQGIEQTNHTASPPPVIAVTVRTVFEKTMASSRLFLATITRIWSKWSQNVEVGGEIWPKCQGGTVEKLNVTECH